MTLRVLMDILDVGQIIKGIWDNFVKIQSILVIWGYKTFRIMVNFVDTCQFLFGDMGFLSTYLKRYGIPGTQLPGLHY